MAAGFFDLEDLLTPEELAMFNLSEEKQPDSTDWKDEKHNLALVNYYCATVSMTLCIGGLIGNILSLMVLQRKSMTSSTYSYLSALSACDLLVLTFYAIGLLMLRDLDKPIHGEAWQGDWLMTYVFRFVHSLAFTFHVTSIWLTLAFTVDRYIMICHPFKGELYCTVSRARKVICGLYLGGVIFNIPKFFEYKTSKIEWKNNDIFVIDLSFLGQNRIF